MSTAEDRMQDALDEERAEYEDFLRENEGAEQLAEDSRGWELAVSGR